MTLSLVPVGAICSVTGIWAEAEIRSFLEETGFTADSKVVVLAKPFEDALIVGIHDKRIAIGQELARKIMVF